MLLRNPGLMAAQRQGSLCGLAAGPRRTVRHLRSCRAAASAPAKLQFWNITPSPGSCPFAQRVWIALEELQVPYDTRLVDKANKTKEFAELYQSIVPDPEATSKVPIVVDTDGAVVTESLVTVEYLDAKYGPKLVPKDPVMAAKARLFAEVFSSSIQKRVMPVLSASTPQELVDAKRGLVAGMQALERFMHQHGSAGGPFFHGADYSIAEVNSASFLSTFCVYLPHFRQIDLVQQASDLGLDRLAAWIQAVLDRPSTQATSLPAEVRLEYGKERVAQIKS